MGSLCVGEELKVFRLNIAYTYVRDAFQLLQLAASLSILLGDDALALILFSFTFYLICADYFLQKPLYIFGNDNPLEYGDLFVSPFWLSQRSSSSEYWCGPAHH